MKRTQKRLRFKDESHDLVLHLRADPHGAGDVRNESPVRLRAVERTPVGDELDDLWNNVPL